MKDYYRILELHKTATNDEIKKQYRFLLQAWHPDKFPTAEQKAKAEEKIKAINEAYTVIGNPSKRQQYDDLMGFQQKQQTESAARARPNDSAAQHEKKVAKGRPSKNPRFLWLFIFSVSSVFAVCVGIYTFSPNSTVQNVYQTPAHSNQALNTPIPLQIATEQNIRITPTEADPFTDSEDMALIPAGESTIGIDDEAQNTSSQSINLPVYYVDKFEVTNSMYEKCVTDMGCAQPTQLDSPSNSSYFGNAKFAHYPVIYVTWVMADKFCKWRNARLPTEAEWEKAARGTDGRLYPWGNEFTSGSSNFCDANCPRQWKNTNYNDGYADTSPAGSFPLGQSPYWVFDMSGNVYEWVADSIYPIPEQEKVVRGGAWSDIAGVNATSRATFSLSSSHEFIGFRCARSENP